MLHRWDPSFAVLVAMVADRPPFFSNSMLTLPPIDELQVIVCELPVEKVCPPLGDWRTIPSGCCKSPERINPKSCVVLVMVPV